VIQRYLTVAALCACIALSAGCAHLIYPQRGSEEALRQRVVLSWEARQNSNGKALWELTTDQHKERVPRESFAYRSNVRMQGFTVRSIEINEDGTRAVAHVDIKLRHMGFDFTFPAREEWLWQRGTWRLDIKPHSPSKGPFPGMSSGKEEKR